ncbi:MAG: hypothetical protein GTO45_26415 [Candidatus Aminicenantes bacterium]|nr:hypothetical protein [Candidatus Aminicenantes bacterium]NIM82409.1 hypothetical protein [Candidatus Aminicenantes bacterium]NIN21957.1 hypothetical protein [Candidatus Aminicenantes bacterium]NIN45473.1 hypothetical protein [Candidatus Aminicenantes bacterium]NIN88304.1 hypothetical protein [Candidatus Aminicenantes bacterium]
MCKQIKNKTVVLCHDLLVPSHNVIGPNENVTVPSQNVSLPSLYAIVFSDVEVDLNNDEDNLSGTFDFHLKSSKFCHFMEKVADFGFGDLADLGSGKLCNLRRYQLAFKVFRLGLEAGVC